MPTGDAQATPDPHDLARFLAAQARNYADALAELRAGHKLSHWMWYVFPQAEGLGHSSVARYYGIQSRGEAEAYLRHPVLGARLAACAEALLLHPQRSALQIMGSPDDLKLCSSMTLFASIPGASPLFARVLTSFFGGREDVLTLEWLQRSHGLGG